VFNGNILNNMCKRVKSLVKSDVILKRLNKLNEYVALLERLRSNPKNAIINDPFVYGNIERYLHLAIQTVIDISNHIMSERNINGINDYRDMIAGLGKVGIISSDLAAKIAPMAGLRNILVHEYLDIDKEKLYDILQNNLQDFKEFGKQIEKIL
jgi:uncharacterized protein YutE (UPF0331/DUF86 family)